MSFEAVNPIWRTVRDRFQKTVQGVKEEELSMHFAGDHTTIAYLIRHNAEVEYMFAEWFFKREVPASVTFITNGPPKSGESYGSFEELLAFSEAADQHLTAALRELPEGAWDEVVSSPMGNSTPREAVGRALYHTGIHSGQIAYIRKHAR